MASPGRPRALTPEVLEHVLTLHRTGFGYRSIARRLREAGIDANWATVRRAVKRQGAYDPQLTGEAAMVADAER